MSFDRGNFEVINIEIERLLRQLGRELKDRMPPGWGFSLMITSYGEGGATFYCSSVDREDMIKMIEEDVLPKLKQRSN